LELKFQLYSKREKNIVIQFTEPSLENADELRNVDDLFLVLNKKLPSAFEEMLAKMKKSEPKGNNSFWMALALDVVGAGLVIYGVTQHFAASSAHEDYMNMSGTEAEFDSAWKKVDDAKSSRNLFYILGGVSLGLGIGVHIAF
jgi:hypothetical protein